ncbi:glycosyltransferase family 2 protein [Gillisia sp. CAL575]|uniref:glycosyltransferase family 2 protein n=1 Tax=Gillisia sp. CAL575 TaxID=985255 RepID=UPI000552E9C9|nr:glycosyltransferase family 2 protein [Gillisia sp. CAL575]
MAVLLTCHNRKEKTIACLNALFFAELPQEFDFDVFLVDDASDDGTAEAVKIKFPKVNIIKGTGNLYWNRGMHLAWENASESDEYDYFLWLNDDVIILPKAIIELIESAEKCHSIICGTMKSPNSGKATYGGRGNNGKVILPNGELQQCNVINGNLVLVPKKVFSVVGNLDPIFPHAIGDYDYALRAKSKGFLSYVSPNYMGYCEENESLPKWCLPEVPLKERYKSLYSPLGNSEPVAYFRYVRRHMGSTHAIKSYLLIHTRLIFPKLWK